MTVEIPWRVVLLAAVEAACIAVGAVIGVASCCVGWWESDVASRTLVIHLACGEPRLHIWCDYCLTSARYEIDLYRLGDNGVSPISTLRRCHRCDDDG